MTTEKDIERMLILHASKIGSIVFKNEVGEAWQGKISKMESKIPQKLILNNCRHIKYGLCNGSSDLIGWTPITITPEMVGKRIAVFTAIEVKKDKHGKYQATKEQKAFISAVLKNGGYAGVADCTKDLEEIVNVRID